MSLLRCDISEISLIPLHIISLDQFLVIHLVKKLFYGVQRPIIVFTKDNQRILSHVTSEHLTDYFFKINVILPSAHKFLKLFISWKCSYKTLYTFASLVCATFHIYFILLDLIRQEDTFWSLHNILHSCYIISCN